MSRFAFIAHPISVNNFCELSGRFGALVGRLPKQAIKKLTWRLPPYKYNYVVGIRSARGLRVSGYGIMCPLLPEQFVMLEEAEVLKKIIGAVRLCKRLGARIVGLGGFTSIVGDEGEKVAESVDIAVTTGNTYTAALAIEGLLRASELMGIDLATSKAAVIGATGDIGSICTKILAKDVAHLILAARRREPLERFADTIRRDSQIEVTVARYAKDAAKDADLILTATSSITTIINAEDLKPGAILCDVAIPPNIAKEVANLRDDILVFEGGKAQVPYPDQISDGRWRRLFPRGVVYGCLAEVMVLAMEGRFENFSLGRGKITQAKVDEILRMARKHGFRLPDFRCGDRVFNEDDIRDIKQRAAQNLARSGSGTPQKKEMLDVKHFRGGGPKCA